ncbi:hypothetical protein COCON_G00086750 [Conger conger]|uniref:Uncharacterized protein n=1 Tax=Conger conger TaxID=82655 RepID=A0A9Q1DK68_CONCO|nr:hypothetical protein COCON_G00086750 [Conger conger]
MFSRKRKELIKTPSISKRSPTVGPHNSTLSILQEQPRRDGLDSDPSCVAPPAAGLLEPGSSPCPLQGRLTGCPSPGATLRRPTGLSRHASAAGAWGFSKARGRRPRTALPPTARPRGAWPST